MAGAISKDDQERLRRDLSNAREQLAATNEILTSLGRHASNPDAVLATIVASARSLCQTEAAQIWLREGDGYRLSQGVGLSEKFASYLRQHPVTQDQTSLVGRVGIDRRTQQIADVLADPEYGRQDLQRIAGYRTLMSSPMLLDERVVGVLSVWRNRVQPFDERAVSLLDAFASQAAIAVHNVTLVETLEARSAELARKVEQLEALGQVGQAVGSSLDLDHVLDAIVRNAVRLSGTDGGSILEYDEEERMFFVRTAYATAPELLDRLRRTSIERDSTLVGRSTIEARPLEVPDLDSAPLDAHLQCLYEGGWRSVAVVPMLREDRIIGALVVRRRTQGGLPEDTLDLLQSFAAQ
jgi:GAF domain-containing protein